MAITDPNYVIDFPALGLGNVRIPAACIKTMKACLIRDQHQRPTLPTLLDRLNEFLFPDGASAIKAEVNREKLGAILQSVVQHCRSSGIPTEEEISGWTNTVYRTLVNSVT